MSQPESENCRYCLEPLDCELGDILTPVSVKVKFIKLFYTLVRNKTVRP